MTASPPKPVDPSPGVPLLVTQRQRAALRALGVSDDDVHVMTPAEAHRRLAEGRTGPVQANLG